jgi:hypothetical protein
MLFDLKGKLDPIYTIDLNRFQDSKTAKVNNDW